MVSYNWYQSRLAQFGPLASPSLSQRYLEWLEWIPLGLRTLMTLTSPYYKARMACHLEVVDLNAWRVTRDGMKTIKNLDKPTKSEEKEIHFNATAKNCLFESFSMDVFNQVFTLNMAHEIWLKLQELHDSTSNVREQKYCLAK